VIVYSVNNQEGTNNGSAYFATFKEARECAKATAKAGSTCVVDRNETGKMSREMVAKLLNGVGWCAESVDLEQWEPVRQTKEHEELYESDEYKIRRIDLRKNPSPSED
jgi:predicted kinase